jgi:hypothetical protein
MKRVILCSFLVFFLVSLFGCGTDNAENPVPVLSSLTPSSTAANMPTFTLMLSGSNFVQNATVNFGGTIKNASFISATELQCQIDSTEIPGAVSANEPGAGLASLQNAEIAVFVINPSPGGGNSNSLNFSVHNNHEFIAPANISNDSYSSERTRIGVDAQNNINVVWDQEKGGGDTEIIYTRSSNRGATWSQQANISNTGYESAFPDMALGTSGDINVVWREDRGAQTDIYFGRSIDSGATWSVPLNISKTSDNSTGQAIAVDNTGNINVAWVESVYLVRIGWKYYIYFSRSTNGGTEWTKPLSLGEAGCYYGPAIATDAAGNIFVAYRIGGCGSAGQIVYTFSGDGGYSWSIVKLVSTGKEDASTPALGVDSNGHINLVWQQLTAGFYDIYHSRSTDQGANWSQPINISPTAGDSENPAIKVDLLGNINVTWDDDSLGVEEIFHSRSTNNGATWPSYANISNNAGESWRSDIDTDNSCNLYIVWLDETTGSTETYFIRSVIAAAVNH